MGEFAEALGDIPPHWREALSAFPTLHKLLSLRGLHSVGHADRLIYLDCDTYFFGDVTHLARYGQCDWYAREEASSSRSHHGYDPGYLDEQALAAIARFAGARPGTAVQHRRHGPRRGPGPHAGHAAR